MERLIQTKTIELPPLTLYVDDIERVVSILQGLSEKPVQLKYPGYRLNISELPDLSKVVGRKFIRQLEIEGENIRVTFGEGVMEYSRVFMFTDTAIVVGAGTLVRDTLLPRRRFLTPWRIYLGLSVAFMALILIPGVGGNWRAIAGLAMMTVGVYCLFRGIPPKCKIWLVRSEDRPNFLERHGEKVVVSIVTAVAIELGRRLIALI